MGFEHAVLGAEVGVAETAVTDDSLSGLLALREVATGLAGRHCVESGCRCTWKVDVGVLCEEALGG